MSLISRSRSETNHSPEGSRLPRAIELDDISKTYNLGEVALTRTGLIIPGGQRVVIRGESGSGKTTLLDIAGGITRPDTGKVSIGGEDITSMSQSELEDFRGSMGYILQRPNLIAGLSNMDNITAPHELAGRAVDHKLIVEMAEELGVSEHLKKYPTGVSGGQAQRISILSAIAHRPDIIFADEPTSALDKTSKYHVLNSLGKIAGRLNSTLVIVSHDTVPHGVGNRQISMRDRTIVEDISFTSPQ